MNIRCAVIALWVFVFFVAISSHADILLTIDNQKIAGELSVIADEFIEFKQQDYPGENEWIKVSKKHILAVVSSDGKIIYPRDKFDENALNYGRIPLRNETEQQKYLRRQLENRKAEQHLEQNEGKRYRVAAVIGGLGGLMIYALLGGQ